MNTTHVVAINRILADQAAGISGNTKGTVAESALKDACFMSILDNIEDSVFSIDSNYKILFVNKGFRERTFAFTGIDFKPGMSIFMEGKNPHITEEWANYLFRAMDGETFIIDSEFLVDGVKHYRQAQFKPIFLNGEIYGVTCYSKNTSDVMFHKEELDKKNLLFRSMFENSMDGIIMVGVHGGLKYISPSVERVLGYTQQNIPEFWDLIHEDDRKALKTLTDYLEPRYGETAQVECRVKCKDKSYRWIRCSFTNMLHEPSIMAFVGNYRDITSKKEIEAELEQMFYELLESDERLSGIVNSLGVSIALLDEDGVIIDVNSAWKQFADENGYAGYNYCLGENYLDATEKAANAGDEIAKKVVEGMLDVLRNGESAFSLEYPCHSCTQQRWFNLSAYPMRTQNRRGVVVCHFDITARVLAERQLLFDRKNTEALINSTHDLIWSIDAEMQIITANQAYNSMLKELFNTDVKKGEPVLLEEKLPTEIVETWRKLYQRALAGETFIYENYIEHPVEAWAEITFNPIVEGEAIIGVACYSRDVTERKKAEEAMQQSQQMMAEAEAIAHFGSWEMDLKNQVNIQENRLMWSDEVFRIFGYEPGELAVTNANFFEAVHPEDRELVKQAVQRALKEDNCYSIDHRVLRPNGQIRWVHEEAKIIRDKTNGEVIKLSGTVHDITDRKEAEKKLRKSEARFRQIVETAQEGIWVLNRKDETSYVNDKICEILEYTREDMIGTSFFTFIDQASQVQARQALDWLNQGNTAIIERKFFTKSGRQIWANLSSSPVFGLDGQYQGALFMVTDITSRKQAEIQLRISNERYELVSKATNDAIRDWNLESDMIYWSEGYQNLFGYPILEDENSSSVWISRIHPEDIERVKAEVKEGISGSASQAWQSEYRYIRSDGSVAFIFDRGYVIHDETGKPVRMVGAMQDVTAQRKAEESLLKSEANLRTIFDHADRSYVLLDQTFKVLSFNTVAIEFVKTVYNSNLKEGDLILDYVKVDKREEGRMLLEKVLAGQSFMHEFQFADSDGTDIWFSVRRYPVRNHAGEIIGVCIVSKDVTKRHSFQIERDRLIEEIVQRNKDLEQFAYIVSHNLRAPVANIVGFADALINMDCDEHEKKDILDGLDISVKRLDNVIIDLNDILQIKKEGVGRKEVVSFSSIILDIILSIGKLIEAENAIIQTDFEEIDQFLTLKNFLYSICFNLISNSIKYRRLDVPPLIQIRSRKQGNTIVLYFKDNGLGIDINRRNNQLFGMYKRFHPTVAEGKGMGLFMVKTQVEALGGKISVESEVNVGTEFKVSFDLS